MRTLAALFIVINIVMFCWLSAVLIGGGPFLLIVPIIMNSGAVVMFAQCFRKEYK